MAWRSAGGGADRAGVEGGRWRRGPGRSGPAAAQAEVLARAARDGGGAGAGAQATPTGGGAGGERRVEAVCRGALGGAHVSEPWGMAERVHISREPRSCPNPWGHGSRLIRFTTGASPQSIMVKLVSLDSFRKVISICEKISQINFV